MSWNSDVHDVGVEEKEEGGELDLGILEFVCSCQVGNWSELGATLMVRWSVRLVDSSPGLSVRGLFVGRLASWCRLFCWLLNLVGSLVCWQFGRSIGRSRLGSWSVGWSIIEMVRCSVC